MTERIYVECACGAPDHLITLWREDGGEVLINVQMSHYLPWWRRLAVAARYVLGEPAKKCHWTDAALTFPAQERIAQFLTPSEPSRSA